MNKQGLVQGQAVDWTTGTIEKVFLSPPYFLLAGSDTIEARLVHSGRLIDQISGEDIRITGEAPLAHATNVVPTVHIRTFVALASSVYIGLFCLLLVSLRFWSLRSYVPSCQFCPFCFYGYLFTIRD